MLARPQEIVRGRIDFLPIPFLTSDSCTPRMYCLDVLQVEIVMAASARLNYDLESWLGRYCRSKGVSKTEVIELGLLMVRRMGNGTETHLHPAFAAFQKVAAGLVKEHRRGRERRSSDAMRKAVRAK
jgi:hypothetical protein